MTSDFTSDGSADLPARLEEARVAAGLTTRDVAQQLPESERVSHTTIANYERGRSSPTIGLLTALAMLYKKPVPWFFGDGLRLTNQRYRCRISLLKKNDKALYESKAAQFLRAYLVIEKELDRVLQPKLEFDLKKGESPAEFAGRLRSMLGYKEEDPIASVVESLESFGIRVIELPTDLPIDGFSAKFGSANVVVTNPHMPNDRARFNSAHEMFHIAEGHCEDGGVDLEHRVAEVRVHEGASHFIMPESQLKAAFAGQSMVRLVQYKERFGISLAAMIYRATSAGLISDSTSKWLWIEFTKRGWRKNEPGNVRPDRATRFEQLLDEAISSEKYTWADLARLTGIRVDELRERRQFAIGQEGDDGDNEGGDEQNENVLKFPQ